MGHGFLLTRIKINSIGLPLNLRIEFRQHSKAYTGIKINKNSRGGDRRPYGKESIFRIEHINLMEERQWQNMKHLFWTS